MGCPAPVQPPAQTHPQLMPRNWKNCSRIVLWAAPALSYWKLPYTHTQWTPTLMATRLHCIAPPQVLLPYWGHVSYYWRLPHALPVNKTFRQIVGLVLFAMAATPLST